jgi:hypothetical protein
LDRAARGSVFCPFHCDCWILTSSSTVDSFAASPWLLWEGTRVERSKEGRKGNKNWTNGEV